uniref:Uncharacterized protein n=1 Tax=Arundo donax TaxID=35708 RepID=A0A0A9FUL8_ARUDO
MQIIPTVDLWIFGCKTEFCSRVLDIPMLFHALHVMPWILDKASSECTF